MTLSLHQLGCLSKRRVSCVDSWTLFSLYLGPFTYKEGSWVLLQGLAVRFRYGAGEGPGMQGPADDLQPEPPIPVYPAASSCEGKRQQLWNIVWTTCILLFTQLKARAQPSINSTGCSDPGAEIWLEDSAIQQVFTKCRLLGKKWQCQKVSVSKFQSSKGRLYPLHT